MQDDTQDGESTEDTKETPMVMPKGQEVALIEKAMSEYAKAANAMKKLAANGRPA